MQHVCYVSIPGKAVVSLCFGGREASEDAAPKVSHMQLFKHRHAQHSHIAMG